MKKKKNTNLPDLSKQDPLTPIDVTNLGNGDDCFGQAYDLSTSECKLCGDSELCAMKMAQLLKTTRKKLDEENHYKDLEMLEDVKSIKKHIKSLIKAGKSRKEIIEETSEKYEVPKTDIRKLYREVK